MENKGIERRRLGRRTALARGLAMAMALGMGGAAAAAPADLHATPQLADPQTTLIRGSVSGSAQHLSAPAPHAARSTAATITVSNCNDSGSGSLRDAVGSAASGDTIDLSGLPDCTISLSTSIVTTVDDLTIQGKAASNYLILDGQDATTPIAHFGTGTITLMDLNIRHGQFVSNASSRSPGGCVFSSGNVELVDSSVKYCRAENTASGTAEGGAIYSAGNISVSGSTVGPSDAINSGSGPAQGGAIWGQGNVTVDNSSVIFQGYAMTYGAGGAQGGGIWSGGKTRTDNSSIVASSQAQAHGSGSATGGGIYSTGDLSIVGNSFIGQNVATAESAFASGGGALSGGTVTAKYSQLSDNLVHSGSSLAEGGGLSTNDTLLTKYTTIADNQATSGTGTGVAGGVFSRGDASILSTTISGNSANSIGGLALLGTNATQNLSIDSSTVSGNTANDSRFGAGVYVGFDTDIQSSTITGNIESNSSDKKYGAGLSVKDNVNVNLSSTIISDNKIAKTDSSTPDSDINAANSGSNATLSGDHNLIGVSGLTYPGDTIVNGAPGLGPLQDNGGLTWTHAVLPGSDAIDTGVSNGFTTDQRGTGYARTVGAAPDIGAYEAGGDTIFANGFENP